MFTETPFPPNKNPPLTPINQKFPTATLPTKRPPPTRNLQQNHPHNTTPIQIETCSRPMFLCCVCARDRLNAVGGCGLNAMVVWNSVSAFAHKGVHTRTATKTHPTIKFQRETHPTCPKIKLPSHLPAFNKNHPHKGP